MTDTAQLNLTEPARTDWDNYNSGSKYQAPPQAVGPDGQPIIYTGVIESIKEETTYPAKDEAGNLYLTMNIETIRLTAPGQPYDGYLVRFTNASVKPFMKGGEPMKGNPSKLGNALRSAGLKLKPQTNAEWRAASQQLKGKRVSFSIDWRAKDKTSGETVQGFLCFPDDPERPGQRKSVLKQGDIVTERDNKGNVTGHRPVEAEVLFANAQVRFFNEPR